jgi:hypothetical protein
MEGDIAVVVGEVEAAHGDVQMLTLGGVYDGEYGVCV